MRKKLLIAFMGLLFVMDVVMTLFNFDIFSRFIKEKRKENDERIRSHRYPNYTTPYSSYNTRMHSGRYPWEKEEE